VSRHAKTQIQAKVNAGGKTAGPPAAERQPKLPEKQGGPAQVRRAQGTQSGANGLPLPPGGSPAVHHLAGSTGHDRQRESGLEPVRKAETCELRCVNLLMSAALDAGPAEQAS
jgi:hypothetical protein